MPNTVRRLFLKYIRNDDYNGKTIKTSAHMQVRYIAVMELS